MGERWAIQQHLKNKAKRYREKAAQGTSSDREFYLEIAICLESHMSQRDSEAIAAREFFASCNLPTTEDKADADRLGWSKLKMFRTMNQEGFRQWR
jgi:hypothetical protein